MDWQWRFWRRGRQAAQLGVIFPCGEALIIMKKKKKEIKNFETSVPPHLKKIFEPDATGAPTLESKKRDDSKRESNCFV